MGKWTINNISSQDNKVVIVTGANSGIGFQMAKVLASKGANIIMACRNMGKSKKAAGKIQHKLHEEELKLMHLDLSSLKSVEEFAENFKKNFDRLDILINNAGVMASPYRKTVDGFEWQFGINHLGHFALTGHLIDILGETERSRVVTVTSIAHFNGKIHFNDLSGASWYRRMEAYRQSKLSNLLFAYELQKRLDESGLSTISVAAHPGVASTNIVWLPFPVNYLKSLVLMSAAKGALPALMGATDVRIKGGEYIGPGGIRQSFGYPKILVSGGMSYNKELWKRLWNVSEELTGISYLHID